MAGNMTEEYPLLKDICWVCAKDEIITPKTTEVYGFPVCEKHKRNVDPESLEVFLIEQFKRAGM
jgi:hypothetical protein